MVSLCSSTFLQSLDRWILQQTWWWSTSNRKLGTFAWAGAMFCRSWVWLLAPYTGWTFFIFMCCKFVLLFAWKRPKINEREAGDGPLCLCEKRNSSLLVISDEKSLQHCWQSVSHSYMETNLHCRELNVKLGSFGCVWRQCEQISGALCTFWLLPRHSNIWSHWSQFWDENWLLSDRTRINLLLVLCHFNVVNYKDNSFMELFPGFLPLNFSF